MTDVNSTYTSLTDAINICLSCIGETPVDAPNNTSTNVVLSKQIIEEVSRDVQSKGWWFNTSGSNISLYANSGSGASENFNSSIPEEARRYISIRAARVLQSRFVGSEELQKFSFQEEQVSLAILTQAHVRNGGNSTSFTAFPTELKALGIEEVMFLQQSAEEKLLSLRLDTELKTAAKLEAETSLIADQERLVDQQVATEVQETAKRTAEKELTDAQRSAVQTDTVLKSQQALTELEETSKRAAEKSQVQTETVLRSQQALTELQNTRKLEFENDISMEPEKAFYDGVVAGTQDTYRDYAAEMRMMGIQEPTFQQTPAYKKVELIKDAAKLRTATATAISYEAEEVVEINKIMRFIGEPPVSDVGDNSLASEAYRLFLDTNLELQGRGWWFNTEKDVEFTPDSNGRLALVTTMLSVELNDYDTRVVEISGTRYLYDLKEKSTTSWSGTVKGTVIYKRELYDLPAKFLEYLNIRVAILLTELYPQSGVDIQRLPKMEQELRAYFKDREFDEANYSIFDNYDAASRIGINRNYSLA